MTNKPQTTKRVYLEGMKVGLPIGAGYFAVSFSLGIMAAKWGITWLQGLITSLFVNASAGEYAGFEAIGEKVLPTTLILVTIVVNIRYVLMALSLSQKMSPDFKMRHRVGVGFFLTDEFFGASVVRPGPLNPFYTYGIATVAVPCWSIGTVLGIVLGDALPKNIVSALSVALFGMFIAIIIPVGKKNKIVLGLIAVSMALSAAFRYTPVINRVPESVRIVILTVIIAAAAAILFPRREVEDD